MENLRHLPVEKLQEKLAEWGEPKFRGKQIQEWLWKKHAKTIEDMTNLPKSLRDKLNESYFIPKYKVGLTQLSEDGTLKNRMQLFDKQIIEAVLIPTEKRMTACVSCQSGCGLNCKFCATGYLKLGRNVYFDEIVDQVVMLNDLAVEKYGRHLTNIVYMGMGEPMLNYKNVLKSIQIITSPEGMNMSPRRITVSTSGIAKMIKRLGDEEVKFRLALSLHAPTDDIRSRIMPINDSNNIQSLIDALNYFYQKTHNKITLEYLLLQDVNTSLEVAKELVKVWRKIPAELINLIEYNPIDMADFKRADEETAQRFTDYLVEHGVNAKLRHSRGKDIDAACGQLANVDRHPLTEDL